MVVGDLNLVWRQFFGSVLLSIWLVTWGLKNLLGRIRCPAMSGVTGRIGAGGKAGCGIPRGQVSNLLGAQVRPFNCLPSNAFAPAYMPVNPREAEHG